MTIKVGVVMDPIATIHFKKDTSLALHAAPRSGCELWYMEGRGCRFRMAAPWAAWHRLPWP